MTIKRQIPSRIRNKLKRYKVGGERKELRTVVREQNGIPCQNKESDA